MSKRTRHDASPPKHDAVDPETRRVARGHLRFGWWALLVFLIGGAALESFHGFKLQFYVGEDSETRRLLWTLAHAHGTLLAIVNILFAVSLPALRTLTTRSRTIASRCLYLSALLLPGGFLLGGAKLYDGDPGLGVLLVPVAVVLLVTAVFLAARATGGDQ